MLRPVALVVTLFCAWPMKAEATDPTSAAIRDAVAARKLEDSSLKGSGTSLTPYRDLSTDGGVLVGLEVALGGVPPVEHVVAVRPIFRTGNVVRTGSPAGRFLSDEVSRSVRLIARDSHAVSGLTLSGDHQVEGLSLRFARIDGGWLNLADAYESDWVGSSKGDKRELLNGRGRPVVGLFGRVDGDAVFALGATFVELPQSPHSQATVATTTSQQPPLELPMASAAEAGGFNVLPLIVFGAVAVPIGLVSTLALRRSPNGARQLSSAAVRMSKIPSRPEVVMRPPSIPCDTFDLDELVHTKFPVFTPLVPSETECVIR